MAKGRVSVHKDLLQNLLLFNKQGSSEGGKNTIFLEHLELSGSNGANSASFWQLQDSLFPFFSVETSDNSVW